MLKAREREATKAELCKILNRIGALEFGVFKLTTGRTSPYYIDLRMVPSFPDAFRRVCDLCVKLIRCDIEAESFDRIAGCMHAKRSRFIVYLELSCDFP